MKIFEKFKNRYYILIVVLSIMMFALVGQLSVLTIAKGDEYRDKSNRKRVKEIYTTAPRGEIRDRNGVVLAASKPSFTAQVLKDEFKTIDSQDEKNKILLSLLRLLEEDGTLYKDEYPIEFHVFRYNTEEDYQLEEKDPVDKVVDIIVENNMMDTLLRSYYVSDLYPEHFKYITIDKAISALEYKGIEVPINTEVTGEGLDIRFDMSKDIVKWKEAHGVSPSYDVVQSVSTLIGEDKTIIRRILDSSIARKLTFEILNERGLLANVKMEEIAFTYDEEFKDQKRRLMDTFDFITFETSAKDDFINIMLNTDVMDKFLTYVGETKTGDMVIPGEILIDYIEKKELNPPVKIIIDEEKKIVKYENIDKKDKRDPLKVLKEFMEKNKITKDFITSDKTGVGAYAQKIMLEEGINPKISVSEWEYMPMVEKYNLLGKYKKEKLTKNSTARETLEKLTVKFEINQNLSNYEKRGILSIYDQMDKQGHRAYEPINIAYGIKPDTVAKIEEGFMNTPSVKVSVEPVRYYPKGNQAAHLLGYLGKISQESEIEKYVNERKYSRNDIIGKTGVEESMEHMLKGKDGSKKVEVDVIGNTTNVLSEDKVVPGNNVYLTIDSRLQETAEKALEEGLAALRVGGTFNSKYGNYQFGRNTKKGRSFKNATSGAVVALDVKTGEVLALANYPDYNPNLFSTGISSSDWNSLFPEDERDKLAPRPLYNIALQTAIQPGSTFKTITGLAALEKGMSPSATIYDQGVMHIGDTPFRCLIWTNSRGSHGSVNIYDALKVSCNYYFYKLAAGGAGVQIGIEDIAETAIKLGMNDPSGIEINIPRETSGHVPNPDKKIETDKILFRRFLEGNLDKFSLDGKPVSNDKKEKDVKTMVAWMDTEETMSKMDVVRELEKMGYDGNKKMEKGKNDFADSIKYNYLNLTGWSLANTLNITIGQGLNAYTPIQMANAVSTMTNGGKLNKVTTIDKVVDYKNEKTLSETKREFKETGFKQSNLDAIMEGMRRVSSSGTARRAFGNFPVATGSKTGTAENSSINPVTGETYDDYSWFIAYGPHEDPEIAVAVVLFQGGGGGNGAPIAREVMGRYFELKNIIEGNTEEAEDGVEEPKPEIED